MTLVAETLSAANGETQLDFPKDARLVLRWAGHNLVRNSKPDTLDTNSTLDEAEALFDRIAVKKSASGTITKSLPTTEQLKNDPLCADTLHFTPDPEIRVADDGTPYHFQPPTMVIRRESLEQYEITPRAEWAA